MARGDIISEVLEYCRNHRSQKVSLDDVRRATGFTTTQVQQNMRLIATKNLWPIITLVSGRWWQIGVAENLVGPTNRPPTFTPIPDPEPEYGRPESTMSNWKGAPPARPKTMEPRVITPEKLQDIPPSQRPEIIRKATIDDQSAHLFEYMGARPEGKLLLRRDDGALFEATLEQL